MVTSAACSSTPCNAHVWLYRGSGFTVPCISVFNQNKECMSLKGLKVSDLQAVSEFMWCVFVLLENFRKLLDATNEYDQLRVMLLDGLGW